MATEHGFRLQSLSTSLWPIAAHLDWHVSIPTLWADSRFVVHQIHNLDAFATRW